MAMVVVLPGTESDAAAGRIAALMRERTGVSLFTRGECAASPGAELIVAASHPGQRIELGRAASSFASSRAVRRCLPAGRTC